MAKQECPPTPRWKKNVLKNAVLKQQSTSSGLKPSPTKKLSTTAFGLRTKRNAIACMSGCGPMLVQKSGPVLKRPCSVLKRPSAFVCKKPSAAADINALTHQLFSSDDDAPLTALAVKATLQDGSTVTCHGKNINQLLSAGDGLDMCDVAMPLCDSALPNVDVTMDAGDSSCDQFVLGNYLPAEYDGMEVDSESSSSPIHPLQFAMFCRPAASKRPACTLRTLMTRRRLLAGEDLSSVPSRKDVLLPQKFRPGHCIGCDTLLHENGFCPYCAPEYCPAPSSSF